MYEFVKTALFFDKLPFTEVFKLEQLPSDFNSLAELRDVKLDHVQMQQLIKVTSNIWQTLLIKLNLSECKYLVRDSLKVFASLGVGTATARSTKMLSTRGTLEISIVFHTKIIECVTL